MELPMILPDRRKLYPPIEYTSPRSYKSISRYYNTKRIVNNRDGTEYHETYTEKEIPTTNHDIYYTVDPTTENRIDLVSYNFYGTTAYWWAICMANNIYDPFDLKLGTILRIPTITSLYVKNGVLSR